MSGFLQSVAEVLEVDAIGIDDEFRAVPEWCSLKAFGLMVLLENDYGAPVAINDFLRLRTVRDLFRGAFAAFAADLLGVERQTLDGASAMGSIPTWDSVMHLRLVMEAERRFGCAYPLDVVPSLKTLDDFVRLSVW